MSRHLAPVVCVRLRERESELTNCALEVLPQALLRGSKCCGMAGKNAK